MNDSTKPQVTTVIIDDYSDDISEATSIKAGTDDISKSELGIEGNKELTMEKLVNLLDELKAASKPRKLFTFSEEGADPEEVNSKVFAMILPKLKLQNPDCPELRKVFSKLMDWLMQIYSSPSASDKKAIRHFNLLLDNHNYSEDLTKEEADIILQEIVKPIGYNEDTLTLVLNVVAGVAGDDVLTDRLISCYLGHELLKLETSKSEKH